MDNTDGNGKDPGDFTISEIISKKIVTSQDLIENKGDIQFQKTIYEDNQKKIIEHFFYDSLGRLIPLDQICGISWSGQFVPQDCLGYCLNPFSLHPTRMVFVGHDALTTPLGNILCLECLLKQEHRKKLNFWSLGLLRKELF